MLVCAERTVEIERGTDQRQMGQRLRKIAQSLAAGTGFFAVKSEVIGVSLHAIENLPGLFEQPFIRAPRSGHRFDQPEGAHVECPLVPFQPVDLSF